MWKVLRAGLIYSAFAEEDIDPEVEIKTFWSPPDCARKVKKGDFVR